MSYVVSGFDADGKVKNEIYIHLHAKNVGRGYKGTEGEKGKSDSAITSFLQAHRENVKTATMTQAKNQFISSLSDPGMDEIDFINRMFNKDDGEEFLQTLDKELRNVFENTIPTELLRNVMIKEQELSKINYGLLKKRGEESFNTLGQILNIISNTAVEFGSTGALLAEYLTLSNYKGKKTVTGLSNYVLEALKSFQETELEGSELDINGINSVVEQLKRSIILIKNIYKGEIKPKNISKTVATSLENNLFATQFAEWGAAKATDIALSKATNAVVSVVGENRGTMAWFDKKGRYVGSGSKEGQNKVDILTEGIKISISETINALKMNVGISNKFYRTQGFNGLNKKSVTISGGGGGTVNQAINAIAGSNSMLKYYMYNTVAYGNYFSNAFQELKNLIIARQVMTMFSTRSQSDFAQVFYINGYVVTIYEIINQLFSNIDSLSNIITLQGMTPVYEGAIGDEENTLADGAYKRSQDVRLALKKQGISGELHLTNLLATRTKT